MTRYYESDYELFYWHPYSYEVWNSTALYWYTINLNTTENRFGDTSFLITVTGTMPYGASASY